MKEKKHRIKEKHIRKHKHAIERTLKKEKRNRSPSSNSSSGSEEWVEKEVKQPAQEREDWMAMTGMMRTYTKEGLKPKQDEKEKKHIDSYNPSTSTRELNPYWKGGGSGLPQSSSSFRQSKPFIKPTDDDDDYYSRSSRSKDYNKDSRGSDYINERSRKEDVYRKSSSWRRGSDIDKSSKDYYNEPSRENISSKEYYNESSMEKPVRIETQQQASTSKPVEEKVKSKDTKYLSDEKMNKLAAKIVKAEILGDNKLVEELKAKLEAAREYRKQNPNAGEEEEDDSVMLMSTNSAGNTMPLSKGQGDPRSKGGKRKAETHTSGQRQKYFGNDDRYSLSQMFQQEKYGNNFEDEAQLAKIAGKHKNPNDDLEDIFMDEISKNKNEAKDRENEKQRAISQHIKMEKLLEGCEYCVGSKNMLKHLMVSCGNKVYMAVPSRKSMVKGQCIITTIQHATCVTALDEDVWEEIMNFRKALTQFFNSQNQDVVFYETATRLHKFPHMVINCVPMPRDVGDVAAIYFKKALLECEAEWSMNKKVVDLKGKNVRKGIPKGLPYFWIDFGMDPGFAHVIEDQQLFPKTFAEEVIAGILDLDHPSWKNPQREYGDLQRKKVLDFIKEWKPFDTVSKNKT